MDRTGRGAGLVSSRAKIAAVATDLSAAYLLAVRENLPNAAQVCDRFHVVQLLNEKLSDLRRELFREATDKRPKDVLKGTRWLLWKNPENWDPERNERQRLDDALALNHSLATAYYLKDDLRPLWEQRSKPAADRFLTNWCARAVSSGLRVLQQFAHTLLANRRGRLAWYDHPISTGPLEGINNKIKLLQRQAFGYRDLERFKLRILVLHLSRKTLIGP